jgi:hypothetical protein
MHNEAAHARATDGKPMHGETDLQELVQRLENALGLDLTAVVLYGSAAAPNLEVVEVREGHAEFNVLCLLARLDGDELARMRPVALWWCRKRHPAPLVFTLDELRASADVFAIELVDIKQHHRILWGDNFLPQLEVPMTLHRLQVERELRASVIRLRQLFLQSHGRRDEIAELMTASASTFGTLFRHALIGLGETAPDSPRMAADRLAARLGFDVAAFHLVLDLREGKRGKKDINPETAFAAYLNAVTQVADAIDRTLAEK